MVLGARVEQLIVSSYFRRPSSSCQMGPRVAPRVACHDCDATPLGSHKVNTKKLNATVARLHRVDRLAPTAIVCDKGQNNEQKQESIRASAPV